ncbi:MAG: nitroreductase family protein [Desulfuromonadales bacterium]|uniref:nitroreductase family protein n=1 Tax=Desulfuromonas sp. KJ2020 TaxID=2919173 RepID=UPI0020A744C6|nr:nitroreductase family protein [Desulfuromonas sp. KJ2020]MCP3177674.1 nitroreductase family protein [Desulfuromonas sp. KJ2020]
MNQVPMLLSLLQKRRSIRVFEDRAVEPAKVALLTEAVLRTYSSRGNDPWEFLWVTRPELLQGLSRAKQHGSTFLAGAPLALVICADESKSDVWIEDCAIAATIVQLTAASLDLGSCWVQIRLRPHDEQKSAESVVRELLDIPENYRVEAIIGLGYPGEEKAGHPASSLKSERIHINHFGGGSE